MSKKDHEEFIDESRVLFVELRDFLIGKKNHLGTMINSVGALYLDVLCCVAQQTPADAKGCWEHISKTASEIVGAQEKNLKKACASFWDSGSSMGIKEARGRTTTREEEKELASLTIAVLKLFKDKEAMPWIATAALQSILVTVAAEQFTKEKAKEYFDALLKETSVQIDEK